MDVHDEEDVEESQDVFFQAVRKVAQTRNYAACLDLIDRHLTDCPDDRCAVALRESIHDYVHQSEVCISTAPQHVPSFQELQARSQEAVGQAFGAMFNMLGDGEILWQMGEQVVGIFIDAWQLAPMGAFRDRLHDMSSTLLNRLVLRAASSNWVCGAVDFDLPAHCSFGHWLFEAVGLLWWQAELGQDLQPQLVISAREEWAQRAGNRTLLSCTSAQLSTLSYGSLFTILMEVWMLERCLICSLLGEELPPLDVTLADVLAEIRCRPLVEPRADEYHDAFYLLTHVIFVLNSYNGCLPNCRSDCDWLYNYMRRSLTFWVREGRFLKDGDYYSLHMDSEKYGEDAVDTAAEALDILRGLAEDDDDELIREAVDFLLAQQGQDGFFHPPGGAAHDIDAYDRLHPTWAAVSALQLDRRSEGSGTAQSMKWSSHARAEARRRGFAEPPPPAWATPTVDQGCNLVKLACVAGN